MNIEDIQFSKYYFRQPSQCFPIWKCLWIPVPLVTSDFIRKSLEPTIPSKRSVEGIVGCEMRRQDSLQYHRILGSIGTRWGLRSGVPMDTCVVEHLRGPVPRSYAAMDVQLSVSVETPHFCRLKFPTLWQ